MRVLPKWIGNWPVLLAITLTSILTMAGCGGSSSSSSGGNVTATPTFNPSAGTYNKSQTVTISDTTAGAVLYCTTDGTTPTTSSPACSQPTTVFKTEFLQAIAVVPGKSPSTVASAGYTIDLNAAATPVFSPAGGTYTSAQNVTIADATTGANIYYTADGSVPTANPVISSDGGPIGSDQTITITDASPNAAIYYTTDNSVPSATPGATHGTLYTAAFSISGAGTVKAVAGGTGLTSSAVVQSAFTIAAAAAAPAFTPNGGPVGSDQTVTITSTSGASIYYTTDPNVTPSVTPGATAGTLYTTPIPITGTETIKAVAGGTGFSPSSVVPVSFTVAAPAAIPTFTPDGGPVVSGATVTITSSTGASIYYTTDPSVTPSATPGATVGTPYTTPIAITTAETIRAIAGGVGFSPSSPNSVSFTIQPAVRPSPEPW